MKKLILMLMPAMMIMSHAALAQDITPQLVFLGDRGEVLMTPDGNLPANVGIATRDGTISARLRLSVTGGTEGTPVQVTSLVATVNLTAGAVGEDLGMDGDGGAVTSSAFTTAEIGAILAGYMAQDRITLLTPYPDGADVTNAWRTMYGRVGTSFSTRATSTANSATITRSLTSLGEAALAMPDLPRGGWCVPGSDGNCVINVADFTFPIPDDAALVFGRRVKLAIDSGISITTFPRSVGAGVQSPSTDGIEFQIINGFPISLTVADPVDEGPVTVSWSVISGAPATTANWSVTAGTATAADFTGGALPTGSFPIGGTNLSGTFTVPVLADNIIEGMESFTLAVDATDATVIDAMTTVNINSNPVFVSISGDVEVRESQGTANYTVRLTSDPTGITLVVPDENQMVMVPWSIVESMDDDFDTPIMVGDINMGDACPLVGATTCPVAEGDAPNDFAEGQARTDTVIVMAGQSSVALAIQVADDGVREGDQQFTVALSNPTGGGGMTPMLGTNARQGTLIKEINLEERKLAMQYTLAAFGRSIASNMVDIVEERAQAAQAPERRAQATIGGEQVSLSGLRSLMGSKGDTTFDKESLASALADTGDLEISGAKQLGVAPADVDAAGKAKQDKEKEEVSWVDQGWNNQDQAEASDSELSRACEAKADSSSGSLNENSSRGDENTTMRTCDELSTTAAGNSDDAGWVSLVRSVQRLLRARVDDGGQVSLDPVSLREMMANSSFEFSPNALHGGGRGEGGGSWIVWGRGSVTNFEGANLSGTGNGGGAFSMDGDVVSGHVGADFIISQGTLMGVAVNYSKGETDYEFVGGTSGDIETTLTSVNPYLHWQTPVPGLGVWATFGYGQGDATLDDGDSAEVETDIDMHMGALGARQELGSAAGVDWAVKADFFFVEAESDAVIDMLPATEANSQRGRLAVEMGKTMEFGAGSQLTGDLELGGRWDGGDAESGVGAELGGDLIYTNANIGLELGLSGHYLLTHKESDYKEWGANITAVFDPGAPGRGLHFSLKPTWGTTSSGVDSMWNDRQPLDNLDNAAEFNPDMVMEAQAGYGMSFMDDRGVFTPFSAVSLSGEDSRTRLGTRLAMKTSRNLGLKLQLYGQEQAGASAASGRSVVFDSRLGRDFGQDLGTLELFSKLQTGATSSGDDYEIGIRFVRGFGAPW